MTCFISRLIELDEGATCFSGEGEFGMGDLGGVLMYEFIMVVLQEVCLYYANVYLCWVC